MRGVLSQHAHLHVLLLNTRSKCLYLWVEPHYDLIYAARNLSSIEFRVDKLRLAVGLTYFSDLQVDHR